MDASFASLRPRPGVAPYVTPLYGASSAGGPPQRQLELPVPGTAVIVALEHRWRIATDEHAPLRTHTSFAGGLTLTPAVSEHDGAYEVVEAILTPSGTAAVLGVPGAWLAGDVVALDAVLGAEAGLLAERLAGLHGWTARLRAFEDWLARRVQQHRPRRTPDVAWALRRLEATGGRVAVGALQADLRCSRRHLAARFAEEVGTTPKAYAQLVRFGQAARRLRARHRRPWRPRAATQIRRT